MIILQFTEGFGHNDVVRRGDLDILAVTLDEGDGVAVRLYHRGIIREAVIVELAIRSL